MQNICLMQQFLCGDGNEQKKRGGIASSIDPAAGAITVQGVRRKSDNHSDQAYKYLPGYWRAHYFAMRKGELKIELRR